MTTSLTCPFKLYRPARPLSPHCGTQPCKLPGWASGNDIHPLLPSGQNIRDKISDCFSQPSWWPNCGWQMGPPASPDQNFPAIVCSRGSKTAFLPPCWQETLVPGMRGKKPQEPSASESAGPEKSGRSFLVPSSCAPAPGGVVCLGRALRGPYNPSSRGRFGECFGETDYTKPSML